MRATRKLAAGARAGCLDAEKSRNFTLGLGVKPDNNTSFTLDYYNIQLKDRIVLGNDIGPSGDPTNPLDRELAAAGIVQLSFFTDALDSSTSGLDYAIETIGGFKNQAQHLANFN